MKKLARTIIGILINAEILSAQAKEMFGCSSSLLIIMGPAVRKSDALQRHT
jgi:hypothetical protein